MKLTHISAILFAIVFGISFLFTKVGLNHATPLALISYRFLIAATVVIILKVTKIIKITFHKSHLKYILLVVIFQPILYFYFETIGIDMTSSSEAGMMIALLPIVVIVISAIFLNEKPNKIQVVSIFVSVGGVIYINFMKMQNDLAVNLQGLLFLFGGVVSAALYNIFSRKASTIIKAHELTYYMMIAGAVFFNAIYLVSLVNSNALHTYFTALSKQELFISVFYLGVVASTGGFFLINYVLKRMSAHVVSVYGNLVTVIALLAGYFVLKEQLDYYHFIGSGMIILGVYGTVRFRNKEVKSEISISN